MKVVTFESEAYRSLTRKIDRIFDFVKKQAEQTAPAAPNPAEMWVDNDEAAAILEVSKRTMQRLRSSGEITYSLRGGRARYTLAEVQRLIVGRVVASKYRQEGDLIAAHQEYRERHKTDAQPGRKSKNNR